MTITSIRPNMNHVEYDYADVLKYRSSQMIEAFFNGAKAETVGYYARLTASAALALCPELRCS